MLAAITLLAVCGAPRLASADATLFLGATTSSPANRMVRGFAFGLGLLVVGFEFEYANIGEGETATEPSLRTGMGNVLAQTPFGTFQLYGTIGAGVYREGLGEVRETNFGVNTGGGQGVSRRTPARPRRLPRVLADGNPLHSRFTACMPGSIWRF